MLHEQLEEAHFRRSKKRRNAGLVGAILIAITAWLVFNIDIDNLLSQNSTSPLPLPQNVTSPLPIDHGQDITITTPFREQFIVQLAEYESEIEPQIEALWFSRWAGEAHTQLEQLKATAIQHFSNGEYLLARESLQQARMLVKELAAEYAVRLATAKREASESFDNQQVVQAERAIERALKLNPDDAAMLSLQKRVLVLPKVLELLLQADVARKENRLEKEAKVLQKLLAIAPHPERAARLKTLHQQLMEQKFDHAVRATQRALNAGDLDAAVTQIAVAKKISPKHTALETLQSQIKQLRTEREYAKQFALGEQAKQRDDWPATETFFERAVQLIPGSQKAINEHATAQQITSATRKINRILNTTQRLSDKGVLDSVEAYVHKVAELADKSVSLKKIHSELAHNVKLYQAEVEVTVISDEQTYILVRGEGQVGKTKRRVILLRPGKHVFEGSRSGYKSKLVTLHIEPGASGAEVTIVCKEKI